jgi:curved DNA-binding protein
VCSLFEIRRKRVATKPMAEDYYNTLGVKRGASADEIQAAYRKRARKYHPDLNPDDKTAKQKFQEVQKAFDVLNDASKRELYDRYGSAFESMGTGGGPQPGGARGAPGGGWTNTGGEEFDFSQVFGGGGEGSPFGDIFNQFRRAPEGGRRAKAASPRRGADVEAEVTIPFKTAVLGGETQLELHDPLSGEVKHVSVKIPIGIADGKKIRLRGQGQPAGRGGTAGDLLITVRVAPHPYFTRRGNHLDVKVPVTLAEAALGGKIDVPTPQGTISLRVPPGTSSGTKLRAKGRGVTPKSGEPGDLYAVIEIVIPKQLDERAQELVRELDANFAKQQPLDPRHDLRW